MMLGVGGSAEYDDNIYRTESAKKDDAVFRITPNLRFLEDEGKFQWNLRYQAPWEKAVRTGRVDGFRHLLQADSSYQPNARTRAFLTDTFSYADSVGRFYTVGEEGAEPTLGTFRKPVSRNNAVFGVQHGFTPRLAGNLAFSHRLFESDLPRRSDNMVYGANANLVYAVSAAHRLGGGAAGTYQDFEETNDGSLPSSQTFFLNVYGTWTWTLDETLTFALTGGPTFVDSNQDAPVPEVSRPVVPYVVRQGRVYGYEWSSCGFVNDVRVWEKCGVIRPVATQDQADAIVNSGSHLVTYESDAQPPSRSDSSWTFFGEATLNKRWSPRLVSALFYRRTESTASGTGSATLDLVSLSTTWQISELWNAGLRADFTRRESTSPSTQTFTEVVPVPSTIHPELGDLAQTEALTASVVDRSLDTDRWGVAARISRRLTKHIYASLRYTYNQQKSRGDTAGSTSDFSNNLVTLGVQYEFDRWHLW